MALFVTSFCLSGISLLKWAIHEENENASGWENHDEHAGAARFDPQ
ncbi:MAG: hypothetical protein ABS918_12490 [Saccharopolyspora rectivirgula]